MFIEFACENCNKFYGVMFLLSLHRDNVIHQRNPDGQTYCRRIGTNPNGVPFMALAPTNATNPDPDKRIALSGFSVNFHECQS